MSRQIGFTICSHGDVGQLLRLVRTLQRVYDDPPIACHHDPQQSVVRPADFPAGVRFVQPPLKTRWGRFSVALAELRALELLYQTAAPDWFVTLSATDYPTLQGEKVLAELRAMKADALLDYREVLPRPTASLPSAENSGLWIFDRAENLALAWNRYVAFNAWLPKIEIKKVIQIRRAIVHLPFEPGFSPFGPNFKCFYGDRWMCGNSKTAHILLNPTEQHMKLRRHYRWRICTAESYFHTILGNTPGLKINKATKRFAQWQVGAAHPRTLELSDLESIILARAHFARKFAADSPILDALDTHLFPGPFAHHESTSSSQLNLANAK